MSNEIQQGQPLVFVHETHGSRDDARFVVTTYVGSEEQAQFVAEAARRAVEQFASEAAERREREIREALLRQHEMSFDHRGALKAAFAELRRAGFVARLGVGNSWYPDPVVLGTGVVFTEARSNDAFGYYNGRSESGDVFTTLRGVRVRRAPRMTPNVLVRTLQVHWEYKNENGEWDATPFVEVLRKYGLDAKWEGSVGSLGRCIEVTARPVDVAKFCAATAVAA